MTNKMSKIRRRAWRIARSRRATAYYLRSMYPTEPVQVNRIAATLRRCGRTIDYVLAIEFGESDR